MASTKPAVVIVPGAWHVPAHYKILSNGLQSAGYDVTTCDMPSTGPPEPLPDMSEDIAVVQSAIKSYIDKGLNVVLVMHSMGGLIGGSACKGLRPEDQTSGKGIIQLVYLASFAAQEGLTFIQAKPDHEHSSFIHLTGGMGKSCWMQPIAEDPLNTFYNDCSPEVAKEAWSHVRINFSENLCHHACPYSAWKEIDSNYLVCELDNAIPLPAQEFMSSQEGGRWRRVERLRSGHSPFLSRPDETIDFVKRCIEGSS